MILNINSLIQIQLFQGIEALDGSLLGTEFCSYFTTEMTPLCASVLDVRRLVGSFVTEIPDDVINQLILEYSILAQDLADCCIDDKWKRYANKWVAYKVALIILYNTEDFRSATSDKDFKQLGDFSISRGGGSQGGDGLGKMIDWLECESYKYESAVRNCFAPLMDCLGLEDKDARPYHPKLAELVEKGGSDINKFDEGRRWITDYKGAPRGNNEVGVAGKKYKTNIGTRNLYGNRSI